MHDDRFLGRIEVRPPLNEAERDYLADLANSSSTLRGTPTGRGDVTVPFAILAWEACATGCCLTWSGREWTKNMVPSLRFLVDHLFKHGAKATGHHRFPSFTCDHVLDGIVAAQRYDDTRMYVAEVAGNRVAGRSVAAECDHPDDGPPRRSEPPARPGNVIELRPRQA